MDILQYAIEMELDGEQYYTQQMKKNEGNPLSVVFRLLAGDEAHHAELLRASAAGETPSIGQAQIPADQPNPFREAADAVKAVAPFPNQAEMYHDAMIMETKSIDLYTDLKAKADDPVSEALFTFLIHEENTHHDLLEELFRYVNRPNEWVESAEFGVREDY